MTNTGMHWILPHKKTIWDVTDPYIIITNKSKDKPIGKQRKSDMICPYFFLFSLCYWNKI